MLSFLSRLSTQTGSRFFLTWSLGAIVFGCVRTYLNGYHTPGCGWCAPAESSNSEILAGFIGATATVSLLSVQAFLLFPGYLRRGLWIVSIFSVPFWADRIEPSLGYLIITLMQMPLFFSVRKRAWLWPLFPAAVMLSAEGWNPTMATILESIQSFPYLAPLATSSLFLAGTDSLPFFAILVAMGAWFAWGMPPILASIHADDPGT